MEYAIGLTVVILKVAFGLGFVIFVHELGHFAVAKMCGVKCEKFYLGFDIAGLKLCKFRWGETEYGIGILPLGGYVKMLGQEDNPARLREEMERAKAAAGNGGPDASTPSELGAAAAANPLYDPRSFLAQSVPKRMAIISAGVIMNLIFAFLMAVVAYGIGAPEPPCIVGEVHAGEAAWKTNLRSGDEILKIDGKEMEKFRDLQNAIILGNIDPEKGVPFVIRRDGKEMDVTIKPGNSLGVFAIGVSAQSTTRLIPNQRTWLITGRHAVVPGSPAALAKPELHNDDKIVQIDDVPIKDYTQINTELARKADRKITVVVERSSKDSEGKPTGGSTRLSIPIEPEPVRNIGLIMKMGPVTAVQDDSPAAAAGIKPGDRLIDPDGDPMTLPDRLARQAGKTVQLKFEREGSKEPFVCSVKLREPTELTSPIFGALGVPALGISFRVLNTVERVIPDSPADKAGLKPGDVLTLAKLISPDSDKLEQLGVKTHDDVVGDIAVGFSKKDFSWPLVVRLLQGTLPGTKIELTVDRDGKETVLPGKDQPPMEATLTTEAFDPCRGLRFEPLTFLARADSLGEMLTLGAARTLDDITVVFRSVRSLSTGQVPMRGLAGPWGIIKVALQAADRGTVELLLFLTFLSANLAVINFMPIPVLDGGHFVLLCYEGIRGKPANEHVQTVLAYIGLALILALMVWVFGLDLGLISRR